MQSEHMSVKVLIQGWEAPHIFGAILQLAEERGWEPCYWIGIPVCERKIRTQFPNCYFHDIFAAAKGVPHPALAHLSLHTIGDAFGNEWSAYEAMALQMMDRLDPWSTLHYHERVDLFRHMVRYWTGVLDFLQPDLLLFVVTPHFADSYILYGLAHSRGTPVLFFRDTAIPGRIYPVSRIEDPPPFLSRYESTVSNALNEGDELPTSLEDYVRRLSGEYSEARPDFLRRQFAKPDRKGIALRLVARARNVKRYPHYMAYIMAYILKQCKAKPSYYKQIFRSIQESRMGVLEQRLCRFNARLQRCRLWRSYHRVAVAPDLGISFVYVPLHYQPELTTCPEGGAFSDQRDMIDILSSALPEGWWLYVKEHLSQFSSRLRGELGRNQRFYSDIQSYGNVRLVPVAYDSFHLIDAAKAVATVTGTAGWEAVVRGTPALVFGYPWYRGCEGVFHVPSRELCKRALEAVRSGYQVDNRKVRSWLRAMEEGCVKAYVKANLDIYDESARSLKGTNAENLSRAIADAYAGLKQRHP